MSRRTLWLITLLFVADAIVVNGRPPRFPTVQGKEVLDVARIERFQAHSNS
jgi:hypothetical protein